MCVIVHQPKGAHLEKDRAERLWKRNPDGGGFAFINDEGLVSGWKSMEFQDFWKLFEQSRSAFPNRDFLIHMRIATHGTTTLDNVHPFPVDTHTLMAHNGIIHGVEEDPDKKLSDTRIFIRDVLPKLPEGWLDEPYLVSMVEEWIGWSRLMFLTTNPLLSKQVYILNEDEGITRDGMWFSNANGVDEYVAPVKTGVYSFATGKRWDHSTTKGKSPATITSEDAWMWDSIDQAAYLMDTPLDNNVKDWTEADLMRAIREDSGLTKRVQFDTKTGIWECWGCDEEVDALSGECACWDKICLDCENIAGLCECPRGYSHNLTGWENANGELQLKAAEKGV